MSTQILIEDPGSIWKVIPKLYEDIDQILLSREAYPRFNAEKRPPLQVLNAIRHHWLARARCT